LESLFHTLGIGCCQAVLGAQPPVRPDCGVVGGAQRVEFGEKSIA
jgi:hypothetical protein